MASLPALTKAVTSQLGPQARRAAARCYASQAGAIKITPLDQLHRSLGAKMVPFCGWSMPLMYSGMTLLESHLYTREQASLFDVSHMLQMRFHGKDRVKFIEKLVVGGIAELEEGNGTLSVITNEKGGIKDDTVINNAGDHLYVVCNAGCADKDLAHFQEHAATYRADGGDITIEVLSENGLLALQGPKAAAALGNLVSVDLAKLFFMQGKATAVAGVDGCRITRCGYTGEDGFEISIPAKHLVDVAAALLEDSAVRPAGLGARDSLRLEAGMCLYGHDINEDISPVEANLTWTIGKRRKSEGGFLGSDVILDLLKTKGGQRRRVGFVVQGAPARENAEIQDASGNKIGVVTSGLPSPSLKKNIAMGYIDKAFMKAGTPVQIKVRKNVQEGTVTKMPFVNTPYYKP